MPYQLDDSWLEEKLNSVSREHRRVMDKEKKSAGSGRSSSSNTPSRTEKKGKKGAESGKSPDATSKGREKKKDTRRSSPPTPDFEEVVIPQSALDRRYVLKANKLLAKGRELKHIREEIPSEYLMMGEDRFKSAVFHLGIGTSRYLNNVFSVKGSKLPTEKEATTSSSADPKTSGGSEPAGASSIEDAEATEGETPPVKEKSKKHHSLALSVITEVPQPVGTLKSSVPTKQAARDLRDDLEEEEDEEDDAPGQSLTEGGTTVGDDGLDSRDRNFLPPALTYSRQFPVRKDYLDPVETRKGDDWSTVWRDSTVFFELGELDAERIETFPGTSHQFSVDNVPMTVHAACGHIGRGNDFHKLCRNCQALSRKRLCCTTLENMCPEGEEFKKRDNEGFNAAKTKRQKAFDLISTRGILIHVKWFGQHDDLQLSAVRRIAMAYGLGAVALESTLTVLQHSAGELGIEDAANVIQQWVDKGRAIGSLALCRTSEVLVTPLYVFTDEAYRRWRGKQAPNRVTTLSAGSTTSSDKGSAARSGGPMPVVYKTVGGTKRKRGGPTSGAGPSGASTSTASSLSSPPGVFSPPSGEGVKKGRRRKKAKAEEIPQLPGTWVTADGNDIIVRIPYDGETTYKEGKNFRLQLGTRSTTPLQVIARQRQLAEDTTPQFRPFLSLHPNLREALSHSDEKKVQEVGARGSQIFPTTTWPLQTQNPIVYGREEAVLANQPARIPQVHVHNTPSVVKEDSELVTTSAALTAAEEITRVHVHDINTLLHAGDNLINEVEALINAGALTQDQARDVKQAGLELKDAGQLAATSGIDSVQTSVYNRRWSLLYGANRAVSRVLLAAAVEGCSSATGALSMETLTDQLSGNVKVKLEDMPKSGPEPAPSAEDIIELGEEIVPPLGEHAVTETPLGEELVPRDLLEDILRNDAQTLLLHEDILSVVNTYIVNHESRPDSTAVDHPTELDFRQFWSMGKLPCFSPSTSLGNLLLCPPIYVVRSYVVIKLSTLYVVTLQPLISFMLQIEGNRHDDDSDRLWTSILTYEPHLHSLHLTSSISLLERVHPVLTFTPYFEGQSSFTSY